MRIVLLAAAGFGLAASVLATPASACWTPRVGPYPTVQVCVGPDLSDILK